MLSEKPKRPNEVATITITVTSKGRITLRPDLLRHLGVAPGERIQADKLPDGRVLISAAGQKGAMADFVGCLSRPAPRMLTARQLREITSRGWAKKK